MSALNHMREIPRLLTAPDGRCQFSVRIRWLTYSRENYFMCHMVSTEVADYKVYARINFYYFILNVRITTRANIFETLHLQLKYIAYTGT